MKRWLVLLLAANWLWQTFGLAQDPQKPKPVPNSRLDWSVLEVVLKDLRTWRDGPFEHRKKADKPILFSPERPFTPMSAEVILDRKHAEGRVVDPHGGTWTIATRTEDVSSEEMQRRLNAYAT